MILYVGLLLIPQGSGSSCSGIFGSFILLFLLVLSVDRVEPGQALHEADHCYISELHLSQSAWDCVHPFPHPCHFWSLLFDTWSHIA